LTFNDNPKTVITEADASAIMYDQPCPRGVMNQFPMPAYGTDLIVR
jgi:hypothetical protein